MKSKNFLLIIAILVILISLFFALRKNLWNNPINSSDNKTVSSQQTDKNQNKLQPFKENEDELTQVTELLNSYEVNLIEAINKNNFSLVEPYLLPDSPLYVSQKKLVNDLYSQGIKEEYISHDFGYIYFKSQDIYTAEVIETIKIRHPNNSIETKEFQWIYTANSINNTMKLSKIEKWIEFNKDIEIRKSAAKADGYYIDEFIYSYFDKSLIDKLNNDSSKDLDKALENDSIKTKFSNLINELRKKGHSFELVNSDVLESSSREVLELPFKTKKQIILNYIDKDSSKKELKLTLTLVLEEQRTGYRGLFGGYTSITDIEGIKIN